MKAVEEVEEVVQSGVQKALDAFQYLKRAYKKAR